jgi:serine/threonine protein kinase
MAVIPCGVSSRRLLDEIPARFAPEFLSVASTVIKEASYHAGSGEPTKTRPLGLGAGTSSLEHQAVLDDFTERVASGEISNAEAYLARLGKPSPALQIELIYREFCLAERRGAQPNPAVFLDRFPEHREPLERLFLVHRACSSSQLGYWIDPNAGVDVFPEVGDEIGPYLLRRELGRGTFARVFLAEQGDLENRQVILKLSTRPTREPWLLARARHSHIVEILSHADVDDGTYQLICMPFLGGATLASVLEHRRQIRPPRISRGDLLRNLDAVAAPEYSSVNPSRPAREILNGLSDCQAMAWITARLADALDHAHCRDVIHGDVKPSNILLTADGTPMLLDFNLARNGSIDQTNGQLEDPGGTLAYMAPERLRTLAGTGSALPETSGLHKLDPPDGYDPHRADIYSLGVVLLEALTSASPAEMIPDCDAPVGAPRELVDLAGQYDSFRRLGTLALIRSSEKTSGQTIPPALRAILERCLAVHPAGRYRRSLELAEDLDRWRTDLPLAYASEPFWAQTVPRMARRNKKLLLGTGLAICFCLVTTYLVASRNQSLATFQIMARQKLERIWDDVESPAIQYQRQWPAFLPRPGWSHDIESLAHQFQRPRRIRLQNLDAPETLATASHALRAYDVLGPGDWRQRDDVRNLSEQDRHDLSLWLMEQAFRYCRALGNRPASPADWRRAIAALDQVNTTPPLQVLENLRRRIDAKLGQGGTPDSQVQTRVALPLQPAAGLQKLARHSPDPPWLEDYLRGVAAELQGEDDPDLIAKLEIPAPAPRPGLADSNAGPREDVSTIAQRTALEHYDRVLARDHNSFWGHYRSAVVCFRLQRWSEATRHLDCCLKQRSSNATLRVQFASCLGQLEMLDEALLECSRAVESAPDSAEFYRSRAFIRASLGQTEGLADDLDRFELLKRNMTRGFFRDPPGQSTGNPLAATVPASHRALDLDFNPGFMAQPGDPLVESEVNRPDELDARAALALSIIHTRTGTNRFHDVAESDPATPGSHVGTPDALAIAAAELEKILALDRQHLTARKARMMLLLEQGRFEEARKDLELILNHPSLMEEMRTDPEAFLFLHRTADRFARYGLISDAMRIADMAVSCSIELKRFRGRSHYYMAKVLSVGARSDSTQIARAALQLQLAIHAHGRFKEWYEADKVFDPMRTRINAALDQLPEIIQTN